MSALLGYHPQGAGARRGIAPDGQGPSGLRTALSGESAHYVGFKSLPLVLQAKTMTDRANCWSITINNPTEKDLNPTLPAGWSITGQIEQGEEKTEHYQACLTTPQVRFSAVKKVFPRAHIEMAKNRDALKKYVHKEDTRLTAVADKQSNIPTLFDYQHTIAERWVDSEWEAFAEKMTNEDPKKTIGDWALEYVDSLVATDIENGLCGIEYIAINPMWRSAWKKFWRPMIRRERQRVADKRQTDRQEEDVPDLISPADV